MSKITAVILAGGDSVRMGETDKPFASLAGKELLQRCIDRLSPQTTTILISANPPLERFAHSGLTVFCDTHQPPRGPLAGILKAMEVIRDKDPQTQWLLCAPVDSPFLPNDLSDRLYQQSLSKPDTVIYTQSGTDKHYLCSLWPISLLGQLNLYLESGQRSARGFLKQVDALHVEYETVHFDPLFNINTPEDLHEAEQILNTYPEAQ